ncbi:MAG: hypothetical protein QNK37_09065 [Acidobacteriota bacterium]|nr:hypothetical protein [Acidobacteriota bacterium]
MMTIADQIRKEVREAVWKEAREAAWKEVQEEYQKSFQAYKKEIAEALKARGITLQEIGGDRDLQPPPNPFDDRVTN